MIRGTQKHQSDRSEVHSTSEPSIRRTVAACTAIPSYQGLICTQCCVQWSVVYVIGDSAFCFRHSETHQSPQHLNPLRSGRHLSSASFLPSIASPPGNPSESEWAETLLSRPLDDRHALVQCILLLSNIQAQALISPVAPVARGLGVLVEPN